MDESSGRLQEYVARDEAQNARLDRVTQQWIGPTVTDFLLNRIDEDEAVARLLPVDVSPYAYACDAGREDHVAVPRDRWLAECAAKRKLVGQIERNVRATEPAWTERLLHQLALPYQDHPDWREEWR